MQSKHPHQHTPTHSSMVLFLIMGHGLPPVEIYKVAKYFPQELVDKLPVHSGQQWAGHLLSAHWSCCEHQSLQSQSQSHPTLLVSGDKGGNRDKGRTNEENEKPTQEPGGWKNVCGCACMLSAISKKQLRNVLLLVFHLFPGSECNAI